MLWWFLGAALAADTAGASCAMPKAAIDVAGSASPAGRPAIDQRPAAHLRTATFALG